MTSFTTSTASYTLKTIVNDFNDYAAEQGNERYPLELFLKVISVSLETIKIVKNLPSLEIHPLDRD